LQYGSQPAIKTSRLQRITAMTDQLGAAAPLADGDDRQEQRDSLLIDSCKKPSNTGIGAMAFARFADDVGVNQIHGVNARPIARARNPHRCRRSASWPAPTQGSCGG
jgi:hypothetical protein